MKIILLFGIVGVFISSIGMAQLAPIPREGPSESYDYNCKIKLTKIEDKVVPNSPFLITHFEGFAEAEFQITHKPNDSDVAYSIDSDSLHFNRVNAASGLGNAMPMATIDTTHQQLLVSFNRTQNGWDINLNLTTSQSDSTKEQSSDSTASAPFKVGQKIEVKGNVTDKNLSGRQEDKVTETAVSCNRLN